MLEFPRRRRIYLMRHGEAAYVSPEGVVTSDPRNVPLTPTGRDQARQQGRMLQDIEVQRAVCSGLPRTVETIGIVMAQLQMPTRPAVETIPQLEEVHGLKGDRQWPPPDGQSTEAVLAEIANPWSKGEIPNARFLGGELFSEFAQRVTHHWDELMADESWDSLLLVLHGAVNRMIFNHVLRLPWSADYCIEQDNCCVNIIDVDSSQPRRYLIRGVNITAYNHTKAGIRLTNMESTAARVAQTIDL